MKYASIQNGLVAEIFEEYVSVEFPGVVTDEDPNPAPVKRNVPLSERFHPDFVAALVAVPEGQAVATGDSYDGEVFAPAPSAPAGSSVPAQVTMRQARLALLAAGKLSAVDAAIALLPTPQKEEAQIEWDYSSTVDRQSNIVALLGPGLELDEAALDALFIDAAEL